MKPFIVLGTRPEIVKLTPVVHEFERRGIDCFLLHTGQHYSDFMSESIFRDMDLREPDCNLDIGSGTHAQQTARALVGIETRLSEQTPDVVVVQGDTNTVLSATLAAIKMKIPVGHVEAGLRSYDRRMPEEYNRRLTDHASDFLFAPTERSADILRNENVWGKIEVTGNTVIDALQERMPIARKKSRVLDDIDLDEFALLTMHRAENVDDETILEGLVKGLIGLNLNILFPAHPRTILRLKEFNLYESVQKSRIKIIKPVGYLDFLKILDACQFVLTDSGGIQEEVTAPSLNKRVFVLRTTTERPEAVESGHAVLAGVDSERFPRTIKEGISGGLEGKRSCPYGSGNAAAAIVDFLEEHLV